MLDNIPVFYKIQVYFVIRELFMEYSWIIFSLCGLVALGCWDFIKKLVLSKGADKEVFLLTCFLLYVPFFWMNMFLQGTGNFQGNLLYSGLIIGILNFCIPVGMMTSLKYLNVSFALVSIRVISSFLILLIGVFLLSDNLTLYNYLGFFLWVIAIFLLSGFSFSQKNTLHMKGIIAMIGTMIAIVLSNSYFKYVLPDVNVNDFMVVQFSITWLCLVLYMVLRKKFKNFTLPEVKKVFPYAAITLVIFALHFLYFLPNIYLLWPLSLGYKMLSYSLAVPIVLSILFLGEKVNPLRIFAFWLTIVSIFLFLV